MARYLLVWAKGEMAGLRVFEYTWPIQIFRDPHRCLTT